MVFYWSCRKLSFHHINRCILLAILFFSLTIPMLKMEVDTFIPIEIVQVLNTQFVDSDIDLNQVQSTDMKTSSLISYWSISTVVYCLGFAFFTFRFCKNIYAIWTLKKGSNTLKKGRFHFVRTDESTVFSFFNFIFLPKFETADHAHPIIEHEKAHARFKHSLDLLIVEIFALFSWFNPILYFYRKSLRLVHEYQADGVVLRQKRYKKSDYLQLMLEQFTRSHHNNLYSFFNEPSLKKRVEMITNPHTNIIFSLKYLILIPIIALLSTAFIKPSTSFQNSNKGLINAQENMPSFVFPLPNHSFDDVTIPFGINAKSSLNEKIELHGGIDFRGDGGSPVIAAAEGKIRIARFDRKWGNYVVITHAEGFETWYAHLKDFVIDEKQIIKQGTVIGHLGNTGLARNNHLHFEVRQNGKRLNPIDLLK